MDGYQLIDAGAGRRLERFGEHVVDRPHPGADGYRSAPERWREADLTFDRERGWSGSGLSTARAGWTVQLHDLTLELRPTDTGQVGLFPEHAAMIPWLADGVRQRDAAVLNLFAYTGLASLALSAAGASVVHVDAARSAVDWARRNASLNGLAHRPIRWLVDDVAAFVAREVRRRRRYGGVVLDPPTYGHGTSGKVWRLARDLEPLLADIDRVLEPDGFVLLTAHAADLTPERLGAYLGAEADTGELSLEATSGAVLRLGAFAHLARAS